MNFLADFKDFSFCMISLFPSSYLPNYLVVHYYIPTYACFFLLKLSFCVRLFSHQAIYYIHTYMATETWDNLTQCLRIKVPVRDINFRFFKYFAMEWWGGMVWPPSGPKKFGWTHWVASLGQFRYQNRQKEANWRWKKTFKVSIFYLFSFLVGQT